ncbi:MAG: hypothetical protein ACK515_15265 [bacterium]|jgi:hypothetical protein|nr:DUF3108 domain-containing protein [Betaproteobacteria bacterium]
MSLPSIERPGACARPVPAHARMRRPLPALLAAVVIATASGCMTLEGGEAGPAIDAVAQQRPGSELTYRISNGYNGEPRANAVHRFDAAGSRLEGLVYEEAGAGGFGRPVANLVARQFDARGDLVAWERADGSRTTFDPPLRPLPFPLVPGQTTRQDVLARVDGDPRPRRVVMMVRVGGWETVDVPAGRFRALRITRDLWLGDFEFHRTETRRTEIDWYAPDAGTVVRASEDSGHMDLMMGRSRVGEATARRGDWLIRELAAPPSGTPAISPATSRNPSASPRG